MTHPEGVPDLTTSSSRQIRHPQRCEDLYTGQPKRSLHRSGTPLGVRPN